MFAAEHLCTLSHDKLLQAGMIADKHAFTQAPLLRLFNYSGIPVAPVQLLMHSCCACSSRHQTRSGAVSKQSAQIGLANISLLLHDKPPSKSVPTLDSDNHSASAVAQQDIHAYLGSLAQWYRGDVTNSWGSQLVTNFAMRPAIGIAVHSGGCRAVGL